MAGTLGCVLCKGDQIYCVSARLILCQS